MRRSLPDVPLPFIHLADFHFLGQIMNHFFRARHPVPSLDVTMRGRPVRYQLNAGFGNNFVDDFSTRTDNITNLFRINLNRFNARAYSDISCGWLR